MRLGAPLLFGVLAATSFLLAGGMPAAAVALMLPMAVAWRWAPWLRASLELASPAGGLALAILLTTGLLGIGLLLCLPAWGMALMLASLLPWTPADADGAEPGSVTARTGPLVLLVLATVVLLGLWGRSLWSGYAGLNSGGELQIWQDWYNHGVVVDMLAQGREVGLRDIRGVGLSLLPYHYLSYGLLAWLAALSGMAGMGLSLLLWWPVGMLVLVLAGSEWVARLRPDRPWLSVLLPLSLFLPDAALLGSGHAFLGWHWLQIIAPGAIYGSAWILLLSSWIAGQRQGGVLRRWRELAVILAALTIGMFIKAQIMLFAGPLLLFWWAVTWPERRTRWGLLGVGLLVAWVVLRKVTLPGLPLLHLGGGGWREYWPSLLLFMQAGWLEAAQAAWMAPGVILVATLGWMLLGVMAWPRAPWPVRCWMILLLGGYLLYALGLDLDHRGGAGTPEELQHRPLVLVLPMWWLTTAPYLFPLRTWARPGSAFAIIAGLVCLAAMTAGWIFGPTLQRGPVKLQATPGLPAGLAQAARFIRQHRRDGDVCQNSDGDPMFRWSALSACPAFWVDFNAHARSAEAVKQRAAAWRALRALPPAQRLVALRDKGVRWYSAGPLAAGEAAADDARLPLTPAFQTGDGYVVYQVLP